MPNVIVDVNQARRDVQARNIHYLSSLTRGYILLNSRDPTERDSNIHLCIQSVCGIDDAPSLEQQIVFGLLGARRGNDKRKHE